MSPTATPSLPLLTNKVALVTGGTRGIGKAIVQRFAAAGAQVAFTYLSSDALAQALVEDLVSQGIQVKAYRSDAADFTQVKELVEEVIKDFGQVDILVNNAGITQDKLLLRMQESAWDHVITANLKSCFNTTHHLSKHFLRKREGIIINMTSVVGIRGNAGQTNYASAKAGIIGLTKSVAKELGAIGVRCNAIAPGFIQSDMTDKLGEEVIKSWKQLVPMNRIGTATEVADICLFLASDMATYVTGQVIQVDGGMG